MRTTRDSQRQRVYDAIAAAGHYGRTDEELQTALSLDGNTQRPRRRELVLAGVVVNSGKGRTSAKGQRCAVWVAA